MDKLGSFINNLMVTIIDKEERFFVRKLAFDEVQKLNHDITDFIFKYIDEMKDGPWNDESENKKQQEFNFGEKNENK
tara:strand:- start:823 stop:1053 length:231 start_codon:yes stop_codon:yes gene_type:complete